MGVLDSGSNSLVSGPQKISTHAPWLTRSGFERSCAVFRGGALILSEDKFNLSHRVFENIIIIFLTDEIDKNTPVIYPHDIIWRHVFVFNRPIFNHPIFNL